MNADNPNADVDFETIEAFSRYIANEEMALSKAFNLIICEILNWVPTPSISIARRSIQYLFNLGLSGEDIAQHVNEARSDELSYPGQIIDSSAFTMQVYELAMLADSVALGDRDGLKCLAGTDAVKGSKFKSGRIKGSLKSTNLYLRELNIRHPTLRAKQLFQIALEESEYGKSPFEYDHADGECFSHGNQEVNFESFQKKLSKAKNK